MLLCLEKYLFLLHYIVCSLIFIKQRFWRKKKSVYGLNHYAGEDAYKELFVKLYFSLNSFARKHLEVKEMAEDVVQDTLYEFWVKKIQFATYLELKTYLYRTVRNKCLNILKHKQVKEKYIVELSQKEEYDFFLNQILEEEVYTLLKEAIDSLPGQMKRVYELALLGHSNEEIAKILSISVDAVKALKKRGKKILQEKYGMVDDDPMHGME